MNAFDNEKLLKEARDSFETTYAHCLDVGYFDRYKLGEWWIENEKDLVTIIRNVSDPMQAILEVQSLIHFSVYTTYSDRNRISRHVDWMEEYLSHQGLNLANLPESFEESDFFRSENIIEKEGRKLSPDFLRFFELWHTIQKETNLGYQEKLKILELGSGYGGQARMAKLLNPDATVFLTDLPFSLFFAYLFVRMNFPDSKLLYVAGLEDADRLEENWDFVFVPTVYSEVLKHQKFDIFINTNSMTEMHNDVISYWFDFLQEDGRTKYIYLDNRFINRCETDDHRTNENACFGSIDAQWEIKYWEFDDPATHSPYLSTLHPTNLRVIAERHSSNLPPQQLSQQSEAIFKEVKAEDWFQESLRALDDGNFAIEISHYLNRWPRTFGVHRYNGTTSGTLYKLWNAVRLYPTLDNVQAMLAYLKFLRTGMPEGFRIEEEYFYEMLLSRHS